MMKTAFSYIVCLLVALCLAQVTAYAQESPDFEHVNGYEEKSEIEGSSETYTDPDSKSFNATATKTTVMKDSVGMRSPALRAKTGQEATGNKSHGQPVAPEDDSILSFNFLYYIIQKFKMQDVIE